MTLLDDLLQLKHKNLDDNQIIEAIILNKNNNNLHVDDNLYLKFKSYVIPNQGKNDEYTLNIGFITNYKFIAVYGISETVASFTAFVRYFYYQDYIKEDLCNIVDNKIRFGCDTFSLNNVCIVKLEHYGYQLTLNSLLPQHTKSAR
jgi:hypothetical protein